MSDIRLFSGTSNLVRFTLKNSSTGAGLTGLTGSSAGLIISTIADVESSATAYTQASSQIQTIATLGTFAAPSASDCRFAQVDATNHPGLYEFQIADARFAVSNAKRLVISVSGATNLLDAHYEIELVQFNPFDGVRMGMTAFPAAATGTAGAVLVDGTGTAAISNSSGLVNVGKINSVSTSSVTTVNANIGSTQAITFNANNFQKVSLNDILATTLTETSGQLAGGFKQWFNVSSPTGTVNSIPNAVAGASGGLFIAGTNAATTVTTSFTTTFTGNLTGSVGSVTGAVGSVTGAVGSVTGLTTTTIATAIWEDTTAGGDFGTAGSIGKLIVTTGLTIAGVSGVTFPSTVASPTNITAGTITTVTNLTNAATSGDFTATMKISIGTAVAASAVASVTAAVTLSAGESQVIQTGTAGAGGASTITIATAVGTTADLVGCKVKITSGTGANQERVITGYVNSTKVVTVDYAWVTQPDATSVYAILFDNAPKLDSGLKISEVTLVDTLTTYTSNTPQTGDAYAQLNTLIGAPLVMTSGKIWALDGSGNAIAPASTALSTATWTGPPTGFLAATFPTGTIANTTNITAGTITTVTTVGTLTTYTGNTPQTGDSYARIGSTGSNLTSLAPAATALSTAQWTNARAGYQDNLSAGAVALASGVTVTTNNDKTGYALSSSGLDAVVVETGVNARQSLALIAAVSVGVSGGFSGSTVTFAAANNSGTNRVTASLDGSNDRTSVTLHIP